MAVELKKLKNDPLNRKIRDVVMSAGETINIYEPTVPQIEEVLSFQEQWITGQGDLEISGSDMVKVVFPLFTDINVGEELTSEEINDIIENPTLALLQVKNHIETIVTEIYKTVILSTRKALLEMDLNVEAYKVADESLSRSLSLAAKDGNSEALLNKLTKAQDEMIEAGEKQKQDNIVQLHKLEEETKESAGQWGEMLKQYQEDFSNPDDLIE